MIILASLNIYELRFSRYCQNIFKAHVSSAYLTAHRVSGFCPLLVDTSVFLSLILALLLNLFGFHLQFALELDLICFLQIVKLKLVLCFHWPFGHSFSGPVPVQALACFQLTLTASTFGLWKVIFCSCFVAWAIILSFNLSSIHFKIQNLLSDPQRGVTSLITPSPEECFSGL